MAKVKQRRVSTAAGDGKRPAGSTAAPRRGGPGAGATATPGRATSQQLARPQHPKPTAKGLATIAEPARQRSSGRRKAGATAPGRGGRTVSGNGRLAARGSAERQVKIRELDPFAKCGPRTSVERLYRVDEVVNGVSVTHLVFLDRHGWYCEHGANCRAVDDVRRPGDRR